LILPREVLQLPRLGCLNIHASLLPRWRGAAPIQRAIQDGDAVTGVCIMQMDEGLDTGPVLCEAQLPITADATAASLQDELAQLGAAQILAALDSLSAGTAQAQPQRSTGATYAAKLSKADARIDWQQGAVQIDRQIRAFNPWPVAQCLLQGEPVKLLRSRATGEGGATAQPGTVLGLRDDALVVACGNGVLLVLELQRAGRKPVLARDFFNASQAPGGLPLVFA
jgi:methionyl-tRNA formyltransferase